MPFIRVRDGVTHHEYDVNEELVAAFPNDYEIVDETPVAAQRPTLHKEPVEDEPEPGTAKPKTSVRKSRAKAKTDATASTPTIPGETNEEAS